MRDLKGLIRKLLLKTLDDLDSGNTYLTEDEMMSLVDMLKEYSAKNPLFSKYQAYTYLNVSRATFDNLVRDGKLPTGVKKQGWKELGWHKKDLDEYIGKSK